MSKTNLTGLQNSGTTTQKITGPHREPAKYGGETYWRCECCSRESIHSPESILHRESCPERTR